MQIKAKVIADSSYNTNRITTLELEYPRFIHGEFMTHRLFSRNAASSRAIPIKKVMEQVWNNPAIPVEWGANQSGMQSGKQVKYPKLAKFAWKLAAKSAVLSAKVLEKLGLHKQLANRVLEPFQLMKTVVTSTEWDNFFHLRSHKDAQPEIKYLSDAMLSAISISTPTVLIEGEWHLPYTESCLEDGIRQYFSAGIPVSLEDAIKISASSCAQVSYRLLDTSLEKAKKIYDMLIKAEVIHASPFEHLGLPINTTDLSYDSLTHEWPEGVTHMDKNNNFWSGNLKGWIQYRHLIPNNTCFKFKE